MVDTVKAVFLVQSAKHITERDSMVRHRVKEEAEKQGYNISTLSRKANIGQNTVRRLWHDPYRNVDIQVLERIAKVLGMKTGDLLEDVPD